MKRKDETVVMFIIHRKTARIYEINCNQFTRDISLSAAEFSAKRGRSGDTEENERIWSRSRLRVQMHLERVSAPSLAGAGRKVVDRKKNRKNCGRSIKGTEVSRGNWEEMRTASGGTIENALMARCEISN